MKIGNHDTEQSVFVIAEIGNNHEGDFGLAMEMIGLAAKAGADAVKFQTIVPEELVSVRDTARIAQLRRFQFNREQFEKLKAEADLQGVAFMSTPFDVNTVEWLDQLVPAWKIASGDNDFLPLLDRVAETGKPVIVSMGLGHHDEASRMKQRFEEIWQRNRISEPGLGFLHCVVSYPTPDDEAELGAISTLSAPGIVAGYSDHTLGIKAAELAVAAGARIVEKHFTIDNAHSDFRDHQLSANPEDFRRMVDAIRNAEVFLGSKDPENSSESQNREAVRRSLVARRPLPTGWRLEESDCSWVRPGSGIRPGEESLVMGRTLKRAIDAGEQIGLGDVEPSLSE